MQKISYLNPINYKAERFYLRRDQSKTSGSLDYRSTINGLTTLFSNIDARNDFLSAVKELGIAQDIIIKDNPSSPVIEIRVKIGNIESNIVDVGYGVSLQIPLLMHAIYMNHFQKGSTILIEQPEIHLHPALQAKFIDVLIKYTANNTYIIETHSEHILRKLQVLVKKEAIKPSDVAVFYFRNENGSFEITNHLISNKGLIEPNFPKGFYDTSFDLSLELMQ